jgi:hypothetical protein
MKYSRPAGHPGAGQDPIVHASPESTKKPCHGVTEVTEKNTLIRRSNMNAVIANAVRNLIARTGKSRQVKDFSLRSK